MRTIAIVTERRADYSRFKPILELIREDPDLDYKLIVTGISLMAEHGRDIDVIKRDGFTIEATLPMFVNQAPDTGAEMTRAIGRVLPGLVDLFERLRPDIILSGFDIGANFAATVASAHMNIPVPIFKAEKSRAASTSRFAMRCRNSPICTFPPRKTRLSA